MYNMHQQFKAFAQAHAHRRSCQRAWPGRQGQLQFFASGSFQRVVLHIPDIDK